MRFFEGFIKPLCAAVLFILGGCSEPPQPTIDIRLSADQLDWVGTRVFQNECSGREACLVHWNEGEAFPSLGIGHFIWYPAGVQGPFVESFPSLFQFMVGQGVAVPDWLLELEPFDAPWQSRDVLIQKSNTGRVAELRDFLSSTRGVQAQFLVQRASQALDRVVAGVPAADRESVRRRLKTLTKTPGGTFAVVDYVNFKGEGLADTERYRGEGWGLLQVVQAMNPDNASSDLAAFRQAAAEVLTRRADNADRAIERERWLPGWLNRLETYQELH